MFNCFVSLPHETGSTFKQMAYLQHLNMVQFYLKMHQKWYNHSQSAILTLLCWLIFSGSIHAQNGLSASATASLLTVEPGDELYSVFGHSAILIRDPESGLDRAYNYGTFPFDQPNFYLNFCRGKLLYMLDVESGRHFFKEYQYLQRQVTEQVLNLSPAQVTELYNLLEVNYLEENRYYKYDFFYDNCATRLRDIIRKGAGQGFEFNLTTQPTDPPTMRQALRPSLRQSPWTQFGIDLVLGLPTDIQATPERLMFLPAYMQQVVDRSTLNGQPLAAQTRVGPQYKKNTASTSGWLGQPLWVMCAVALLGFLSMLHPLANRIFDWLFWSALGVAGVIIFFLWFLTDHQATKTNLNLLWAWPTHLLFGWRKTPTPTGRLYFIVVNIITVLLLGAWYFLPQELPLAILPIVVLIAAKSYYRARTGGRKPITPLV
jgi:Domain of unknown function (DUF4105)